MKTKSFKILLAFVIMLGAVILFNMNTVKATAPNVIMQNPIEEGAYNLYVSEHEVFGTVYVGLGENPFKIYDLSKNTTKLDSLVKSDNYVYESVYIELASNINKVTIKETNTDLEIVSINGTNYAKYDMKVFKKENNSYMPYLRNNFENTQNTTVQYKENSNIISEQNIIFSVDMEEGSYSVLRIVDENNKDIGNRGFQGDPGWFETTYSTAYDYSNGYYKLYTSVNVGDSIVVDKLGTLTYSGIEKPWDDEKDMYVYKKKITDTNIFSKEQDIRLIFEVIDKDTKKGAFNYIGLYIMEETRQTYKVNDETNNVEISLSGVTDSGMSLKADVIDKNDSTYIEMINHISTYDISANFSWINIFAYDIKLVGGSYEGDLILTFDLGAKYNGQIASICHEKADGTHEHFSEKVTNGKVSITVNELSPFMIALKGENATTGNETTGTTDTTNSNEKDETPKTGTIDSINYILPITMMSAVGAVALRRKEEK